MDVQIILNLLTLTTVLFRESSTAPRNLEETPRLAQGEASALYNYPFLCTIHRDQDGKYFPVSSCTIFSKNYILMSFDTLDRYLYNFVSKSTFPLNDNYIWQQWQDIYAVFGADNLNVFEDPGWNKYATKLPISKLYASKTANPKGGVDAIATADGVRVNISLYERNPIGELAGDLTIGLLGGTLRYGPTIMPIPLISTDYNEIETKTDDYLFYLEKSGYMFETCSIAGWGTTGNNDIMQHDLVYVTYDECKENLCVHYPDACNLYPVEGQHVCFSSLQYGDVCVYDEGSPVFCPWFGRSVFAVLIKAFDCGLENMPAVYTVVSYATRMLQTLTKNQRIEARPNYNARQYTIGLDTKDRG